MTTENSVGGSPKIAFVTALTEQSTSDLEGVGTTRTDQYGKRYRWVKNSGDNAARAGAPACFDLTSIAAAYFLHRIPVEDIASADLPYFAGVWLAAVAAASYGWIQTFGVSDDVRIAAASATSYAVGDILVDNCSTDTAGTGAAAPHAFTLAMLAAGIFGTSTGTAYTVAQVMQPHVVLAETCASRATAAALTTAQALQVFVRGLIP
jgi:hypothetical protein